MDDVDAITDFIIKYSGYINRETLKERIKKHLEYNTIIYVTNDRGEILAVATWNIEGHTAHIIDTMIREDCRNNGMLKCLMLRGLLKYPYVTQFKWERRRKYPDREIKSFPVKRLIN